VLADTAAPVFSAIPADLNVPATSSAGAIVNYAPATASDSCSAVALHYSQESGTLFPVGTTAPSALEQLDALIATVNALPVKETVKTLLLAELTTARAALKRNQPQAAVRALRMFEATVETLRKTRRLTTDQARQLTTASQAIRATLNRS
jgi:hypothetical protein